VGIFFLDTVSLLLKTVLLSILFVWIRATIPRMRYDHLIFLTWKRFLPVALGVLIILTPIRLMLS
jgi:NADH:ubiquinone oxidoreductase subunit H